MLKKLLCIFVTAFYAVSAYSYFQYGDMFFNITSSTNMTVEVTKGNVKYENAVYDIPNQVVYKGEYYYVTRIGNNAFSGCTALTTINFDKNTYVTSIGNYAFSGCNALNRISIPEKVTSIGNYAFSGCMKLMHVTIEDATSTLSLGYGAMNGSNYGLFADCDLRSFYWGRPLSYNTSYGYSPIANQTKLTEITIGPNITTISPYMFYGNTAISSIELPTTVTTLGNHAFHGFKGLKSFTIPKHITSIGEYVFAECTGLTSFTIPEWVSSISKGLFAGCTGFTSFTIPGHITSIGHRAFDGCKNLKSLKLEPGTVKLSLGFINHYDDARATSNNRGLFNDCPIEKVELNRELGYNSGANYGYSPFANIKSLKEATIGEQLTQVYGYLFYGNTALTEVSLAETITSIGAYAFSGCAMLSTLNMPASTTSIGSYAFQNCTGFTTFTFGAGVKSIADYAFIGCTGLTSFTFPGHVTSVGHRAFDGCSSIKSLKFESGTEKLSLGWINYNGNNGSTKNRGLFNDCPIEKVELNRDICFMATPTLRMSICRKRLPASAHLRLLAAPHCHR